MSAPNNLLNVLTQIRKLIIECDGSLSITPKRLAKWVALTEDELQNVLAALEALGRLSVHKTSRGRLLIWTPSKRKRFSRNLGWDVGGGDSA